MTLNRNPLLTFKSGPSLLKGSVAATCEVATVAWKIGDGIMEENVFRIRVSNTGTGWKKKMRSTLNITPQPSVTACRMLLDDELNTMQQKWRQTAREKLPKLKINPKKKSKWVARDDKTKESSQNF